MNYTTKPTSSTPELTSTVAKAIYTLIKTHGTADNAFKAQADSLYDPEHFKAVDGEIDRIVSELNSFASGKIVTPEVPAEYDEEGNVTKEAIPAVRYQLTTESKLKSQVSSTLLNVGDILNDIEPNGIWAEYKAIFSN